MLKRLPGLLISSLLIISCGSLSGINGKQMIFTTTDKQELRINLPTGKGEENYKTDMSGAMEQFCAYEDGSVIYVARHTTWPTPNGERVQDAIAKSKEKPDNFSGKDDKGLHWKEVHIEEFMIGYAAVPPARVESFNRALSSVRIR
jgi:hypothetical protein